MLLSQMVYNWLLKKVKTKRFCDLDGVSPLIQEAPSILKNGWKVPGIKPPTFFNFGKILNYPATLNNKDLKALHYIIHLIYFFFPFLTCLPMIFSSRLSQSIFNSDMGSWIAQRSASSVTFFSRSPAWWLRRSISICSWYASPLNSWETQTQKHNGAPAQSIQRTIQPV